jgi:hypothetical protein
MTAKVVLGGGNMWYRDVKQYAFSITLSWRLQARLCLDKTTLFTAN